MKKIAIVVQRYGLEVNGGAEYHARVLAEQLQKKYDVEIITTCALDYSYWENHFPEGKESINGINVYRFENEKKSTKKNRRYARIIQDRRKFFPILKFLGIYDSLRNKGFFLPTEKDAVKWLESQGPHSPKLIEYIIQHKDDYDVFIFFTYLYHPTAVGMNYVKDKAIFIPTAHDEPPLYTLAFKDLFSIPKFIMYNTVSEKNLVEENFKNVCPNCDVAGVGISKYTGEESPLPEGIFSKKYFIYVGRIDASKGCDVMINFFIEYKNKFPNEEIKLVLVGKNYMKENVSHPDIFYTGFIDEQLKNTLIKNAIAMIMPSEYESLSMVTLESMIEKVPVIVNRKCEVLHDHILKSSSGDSYSNDFQFYAVINKYLKKTPLELDIEGDLAENYVIKNYSWENVLSKFDKAIDKYF